MLDILVVEDSLVMQAMLSDALKDAGFNVTTASTFAQAKEAINLNENGFFLTTLDIGLPDTKGDEIVTYMIERSIPSIVYSGSYDYDKVEQFMSKPIIDYVIKNSDNSCIPPFVNNQSSSSISKSKTGSNSSFKVT